MQKPARRIWTALAIGALFSPLGAWADNTHWDYTGHAGAKNWGTLNPDFATCKLGNTQSPINIETRKAQKAALTPLALAYTPGAAEVVNNGHTIQVNLKDAGTLTLDGTPYQLVQFHFHTPSEEKVDGRAYPLVAHLVHKSAEGKLAVVAVLFKQGAANAALQPVFSHMPTKAGDAHTLPATFDVARLLPAKRGYYAFEGSLTTPPCSEGVRWQVLKNPVTLSAGQLSAFKQRYTMNARPVQPLNGRVVRISG